MLSFATNRWYWLLQYCDAQLCGVETIVANLFEYGDMHYDARKAKEQGNKKKQKLQYQELSRKKNWSIVR